MSTRETQDELLDELAEPVLAELVLAGPVEGNDTWEAAGGGVATLAPPRPSVDDDSAGDLDVAESDTTERAATDRNTDEEANDGPTCGKCGAGPVDLDTWCSYCGYYPRLGSYVDIEAEREIEGFGLPASVEPTPFWEAVPAWVWKLSAALVGVLVLSIVGRLVTPAESSWRALWSFGQFMVAFFAFASAHIWAFVKASIDDSSMGCMDMLTKPLAIWGPTIRELPESERRLILGGSGFIGALLAVVLVGGMDYDRLFDWGIEPPPPKKSNSMSGMTAGGGGGGDGEIKVNDVDSGSATGAAEEDENSGAGTAGEMDDEQARQDKVRPHKVDCIVIGFVPREQDPEQFDALVLAANIKGRLRAVGIVREGISAQMRVELTRRMSQLRRADPIVPCRLPTAVWLDDGVRCRIRFSKWTERLTIRKARFEGLLRDEAQQQSPTQQPVE